MSQDLNKTMIGTQPGSKIEKLSSDHRSFAGYGGYVSILSTLFLFSGWASIR